jgi:release factor glutamine methyltransferase
MDLREALQHGVRELRAADVGSPALAAELLLMQVLDASRAWLYTHITDLMDPAAYQRYGELVRLRAAGTPTQYLTGKQEFWGLEFEVTPDVLIPRPETEHVMEVALERFGQQRSRQRLRVLDVGTGSGCLAVALARELPDARVYAADISRRALLVARRNAVRHGVAEQIAFVEGDLLGPFAVRSFDLVVSNPPYVGRFDEQSLAREVRGYEPAKALIAGDEGVEIYPNLVTQAAERLVAGGLLVVEMGYGLSGRVRALFDRRVWRNVAITNDLAGIPRVLAAESVGT